MNSFRLTLVLVFSIAATMIACSDDEAPTEPGDSPPEGTNPSNVCEQGLCVSNAALKQECEAFLDNCLQIDDGSQHDECVAGAWVICNG